MSEEKPVPNTPKPDPYVKPPSPPMPTTPSMPLEPSSMPRSSAPKVPYVDKRSKEELIADAREIFDRLVKLDYPSFVIDMEASEVPDLLKKAGVGYEALDPSGRRSADDMHKAFDTAYRENGLRVVREDLSGLMLENGLNFNRINLIKSIMSEHGFTAADVLNHGGAKLSSADAEKSLAAILRRAHLYDAASDVRDMRTQLNKGDELMAGISADLAGSSLMKVGIDPDANRDGRTSIDEINRAVSTIRDMPRLAPDQHGVPSAPSVPKAGGGGPVNKR